MRVCVLPRDARIRRMIRHSIEESYCEAKGWTDYKLAQESGVIGVIGKYREITERRPISTL